MRRFLVVMLIFLFIIMLGACGIPEGGLDPTLIAYVEQTQTATMLPHASVTPSPSAVPKQAVIVNALNAELQKEADPLEKTLDAKFSVLDIGFDLSGNPPATTTMEIHVECEWITKPSCTEQRAFIALANAFKGIKPDIRKNIIGQVPDTIVFVQVRAFDHMNPIGMIEIGWGCLLDFADGNITGDQLAARALQLPHP